MSNIYSFEKDDYPENGRDIYIFFDDNSGKSRYDSIPAYVNDEGQIRTVVPFTNAPLFWTYKDDLELQDHRHEDFVSLTIYEFNTTSDGDDEDCELGIFRDIPSYQDLRTYIKKNFNGRLTYMSSVGPKLSILEILDEPHYIISVYGDFTVDIKGMLYHGIIELYEINEWN